MNDDKLLAAIEQIRNTLKAMAIGGPRIDGYRRAVPAINYAASVRRALRTSHAICSIALAALAASANHPYPRQANPQQRERSRFGNRSLLSRGDESEIVESD